MSEPLPAIDPLALTMHMVMATTAFNLPGSRAKSNEKLKEFHEVIGTAGFIPEGSALEKQRADFLKSQKGHLTEQQSQYFAKKEEELVQSFSAFQAIESHITRISLGDLSEAVVVQSGGKIGVYFRETTNAAEMGSNFNTAYRFVNGGGAVADGYAGTLDQTLPRSFPEQWHDLTHGERPASFRQAIEETVAKEMAAASQKGLSPEITLAGISRGGALAQVLASEWMKDGRFPVKGIYTMASPMAGNDEWARDFNRMAKEKGISALRMEIGGDIVPKLPPLFFTPAGQLLYFPASPELGDKPILYPSPAFLAKDQELICERNRHDGRSDFRESVRMHANNEFREIYDDKLTTFRKDLEAAINASNISDMADVYNNSVIHGGSKEESAILQKATHHEEPEISVPVTPISPAKQPPAKQRQK